MTLAEKRAAGHRGEVLFCQYAIAHGRGIRAAHPSVLAELGIEAKSLDDKASAFGDVSLHGLVPALHEIKDKRKSGAAFGGSEYGWEIERLEKTIAATARHACLAYYTILDKAGWLTVKVLTIEQLRRTGHLRIAHKGKAAESLHAGEMRLEPKGVGYIPVRFFRPLESTWPPKHNR